MKTLHLIIAIIFISGLLSVISNPAFAPCLVGVTSCGPPPGVTVVASPDSQFYEKNDTINIQGQLYVQNYTKPVTIQVINPNSTTLQGIDVSVTNGTFGTKIVANFDKTGLYQILTCVQNWCDRSYFKFISEPYRLTAGGTDFLIKYKSFADLIGMEADVNSQALRVHISNATAQGLQFVVELPRALIDSKGYDGKDAGFRVWIGMHQPDKYMQPTNFTEIASNDQSRTLAIDIPYEPVPNSAGVWDFKIMSADVASGPGVSSEPPLKLFRLGMPADQINCKKDFVLILKSEDGSPACVKHGTAQKLIERGWAQSTSHPPLNTTLVTNDELERIHTLCNDPVISTNGSDTLITCPIPENVTSWIDISPPVYKRTVCNSTYGCSGPYVYVQQNQDTMISEKQKEELENFVLKDISETKSWPSGWKLDHVEIQVRPGGVFAYMQFFIPVVNPTYKYCGWYPQVGIDLERKEIFEKDNLIPRSNIPCTK